MAAPPGLAAAMALWRLLIRLPRSPRHRLARTAAAVAALLGQAARRPAHLGCGARGVAGQRRQRVVRDARPPALRGVALRLRPPRAVVARASARLAATAGLAHGGGAAATAGLVFSTAVPSPAIQNGREREVAAAVVKLLAPTEARLAQPRLHHRAPQALGAKP